MINFSKGVNKAYTILLFLSIITIVLLITMQVIVRYLFNSPFGWAQEITMLSFCWMTFIGSAICTHENSHLEVDYFFLKFSKKWKKIVNIFIAVIVISFNIFLTLVSVYTLQFQNNIKTSALRIPFTVFTFAIVFGSIGMLFFFISNIFDERKKQKNENYLDNQGVNT